MKKINPILIVGIVVIIAFMFLGTGIRKAQEYYEQPTINKAILNLSNSGIIVIDSSYCYYYQDSPDTVLTLSEEQLQALWLLSKEYTVVVERIKP